MNPVPSTDLVVSSQPTASFNIEDLMDSFHPSEQRQASVLVDHLKWQLNGYALRVQRHPPLLSPQRDHLQGQWEQLAIRTEFVWVHIFQRTDAMQNAQMEIQRYVMWCQRKRPHQVFPDATLALQPIPTFPQIALPGTNSREIVVQDLNYLQQRMADIQSGASLREIVQPDTDVPQQITDLHQQIENLCKILQWQNVHADWLAEQHSSLIAIAQVYQQIVRVLQQPPLGFEHLLYRTIQ